MFAKIAVLTVLVAVAAAQYQQGHHGQEDHHVDYYAPPHYEYNYGVEDPHTGDKKSHHETREGDVVKGQYQLIEPDGTLRIVDYTANHHDGFNAVVTRKGHAAHPIPAPVHHAPIAVAHAPVVASLGHGHASSYSSGGVHVQHHY